MYPCRCSGTARRFTCAALRPARSRRRGAAPGIRGAARVVSAGRGASGRTRFPVAAARTSDGEHHESAYDGGLANVSVHLRPPYSTPWPVGRRARRLRSWFTSERARAVPCGGFLKVIFANQKFRCASIVSARQVRGYGNSVSTDASAGPRKRSRLLPTEWGPKLESYVRWRSETRGHQGHPATAAASPSR